MQDAETFGFRTEVAVMTAVPDVTPVTKPFSSTVATSGLAELQVTLRSVTVQGSTAADRVTLDVYKSQVHARSLGAGQQVRHLHDHDGPDRRVRREVTLLPLHAGAGGKTTLPPVNSKVDALRCV